jgi:uncharacterized phage protein (TIGR02216 family)
MRRCMEWGMGVLRWTPETFWNTTPDELAAAISGYQEAHGAKPAQAQADGSISTMKAWLGTRVKGRK